jgi:hypothetical protein
MFTVVHSTRYGRAMDILRPGENEPDRDSYTDEPVFDLGA